jgi:hypothetical protein
MIPLALAFTSLPAQATGRTHGTLCTSSGSPVYDFELALLISSNIPKCSKKLIVATQCYGGNLLNDFSDRSKTPNTAVISATKPGQRAYYGGYDDDAAAALKPGPGRNGNDVHVAGRNGRHRKETPKRGGTMSAGNFNLDNVSDNGPVRSRHIVYYAGIPGGADDDYRDTISDNFAGEANTTVHTAGGNGGGDGYDHPGTADGLSDAIESAADEINNAEDPCKEQFILFISDHGDLEKLTYSEYRQILRGETIRTTITGFESFVEANPEDFFDTADNVTSYSVLLPLGESEMRWNVDEGRMLNDGDLFLEIFTPDLSMELGEFRELYADFDGSGIIGDDPMDAVLIEFDIPEDVFVDAFFDNELTTFLSNDSEYDLPLGMQGLHSGEISKGEGFEPPSEIEIDPVIH